jgi:mRNA interferase MazF
VSVRSPTEAIQLLWVLMITSAANSGWHGDISLEDRFAECGLKVPCVVRCAKITTIETKLAQKSGSLPADIWSNVRSELEQQLF